ncbi:restriction endonuclease subunit S [Vibrio apostichopi]|uniref:restriction endonuclease subunit S n=1 Tax=Vibrio apostichopi TaxID=3035453 RepID=UPI002572C01E|nr:restriction endonuclease subunit S [Vibrio sp. FE10]
MNQGWVRKKLKDCFKLKSGDGLTAKNMIAGDYPVFGGNSQAGTHNTFNLSGDNVIVGRVGALCGNARHITEDIWLTDNAFKIIDEKYDFDNKFLTYLLNFNNLRSLARQAAQPVISNSSLKDLELEFPLDVEEQKRIVTLLDTVFADLEQTRAKTEQNLKNACELFDSYLQQVFSQKGEGWIDTTLGEITGGIATGPFGSLLHKSDYIEDGIPLVNPAHIVGQKIVPDTRKTISEETALRLSAYKMKAGDIVIGRRGEMGRCALITQDEDGYLCGTGSFIIKSSDRCDGGFLVRFLRSASCVASLEKIAGGAVMPNLSNSSLSKFGVRVPSKNKQIEITKLIDQLSIEIEKVVDIYNEKLNSIDELKKSILQKAFSGELTHD